MIAVLALEPIEPSGLLPLSVPRPAGQLPVHWGQVRGGITSAFGEGLGYTTVPYSEPTIQNPVMSPVRTGCPASMATPVNHRASAAS
ncbi:hypothetical protein [Streptomyces stelliscabiei]|uniref:hypothetical protein n=1 Tax=Streptomyces stelliscabiei TaxID=146820 RepID=UPI002FF1BA74